MRAVSDPSTQNHCRAFNPERGRSMSYDFQAFTITTTGTDTPTFSEPSQITSVGYVSHSASSCSGFTTLTSGSSTTLSALGDNDICASYSCPTGCTIASWTISWSS